MSLGAQSGPLPQCTRRQWSTVFPQGKTRQSRVSHPEEAPFWNAGRIKDASGVRLQEACAQDMRRIQSQGRPGRGRHRWGTRAIFLLDSDR